jgi:hypothetical protein
MNIKKIAVLFSLVLCAVRMNAQEKSLEEIQKQVRDLQSQFTTHYNSVFVDYKTKISQGQDQIQRLQVRKQAELDSLELLKLKFQSDFDRDKVFYQNHEMLSELTNLANSAIDKGLLLNDMESFKSYCKEGFSGSLIDCYTSNKGVVALFITEEKYLKKLDNILGDIATIRILFWFEKQNYIFTLDNLSFSNFKKSRNFYFNKSEEEIEKSNEIEKFIEKYNVENQNEYTVNGGVPRLSALDKNKLIDLTNSKQAIEAKSNFDRIVKEISSTTINYDNQIANVQRGISPFDLASLNKRRIADSLELVRVKNYYFVEYPKALDNFNMELKKCQENDNIAKTKYQEELKIYETRMSEIEKNISKLEKLEIKASFELVKAFTTDPNPFLDTIFSERMRSVSRNLYGTNVIDKDLIKEYPCQRYYRIIIRTRNSSGGYEIQGYLVQFTDEKFTDILGPIPFETVSKIDDYTLYIAAVWKSQSMFKTDSCKDSKFFNAPAIPLYQYEMKKNRKPIFDKFNFKYQS